MEKYERPVLEVLEVDEDIIVASYCSVESTKPTCYPD